MVIVYFYVLVKVIDNIIFFCRLVIVLVILLLRNCIKIFLDILVDISKLLDR